MNLACRHFPQSPSLLDLIGFYWSLQVKCLWGMTDLWIRGSPESHEHRSPSWSSCWKHRWGAEEDKISASTVPLVSLSCLITDTPCLSGVHPCPPVGLRGLAPRLDSSGPAGRCFHPPRVRGSLLLVHQCNPGRGVGVNVLGWPFIHLCFNSEKINYS